MAYFRKKDEVKSIQLHKSTTSCKLVYNSKVCSKTGDSNCQTMSSTLAQTVLVLTTVEAAFHAMDEIDYLFFFYVNARTRSVSYGSKL